MTRIREEEVCWLTWFLMFFILLRVTLYYFAFARWNLFKIICSLK